MPIQTEVELSARIFCFYTLLNAGGYLPEKPEAHPVRERVLSAIRKRLTSEVIGNIKEFLAKPEMAREYWFPYRTWVLCHGQPPQFEERAERWKDVMKVRVGDGLRSFLKKLWEDYEVANLWEREKAEYQNAENLCEEHARGAVRMSVNYLRLKEEEVPFEEFVVIPNFLDEYHRGIGPLIGDVAYAILGPSPNSNDSFPEERIQHELLHSLLNATVGNVFLDATNRERSKIRETFIHGIVLRTRKDDQDYLRRKRENLLAQNIAIDPLLVMLERYENAEETFADFLKRGAGKIKEACR